MSVVGLFSSWPRILVLSVYASRIVVGEARHVESVSACRGLMTMLSERGFESSVFGLK